MGYITVTLAETEKKRLIALAERELRHPRQQAAKLLMEALDRAEETAGEASAEQAEAAPCAR